MTEITDPASLVAAAQQAAAAGDYPAAAHRLRDAAEWQERQLGPDHPDLVNTLNNLGVVLERAGRLEEAEGAFRRGYAIARKVFPAEHPFVTTAAANLREFCEANGIQFNPHASRGAAPPPPASPADTGGLSEFPLERALQPPPPSVARSAAAPPVTSLLGPPTQSPRTAPPVVRQPDSLPRAPAVSGQPAPVGQRRTETRSAPVFSGADDRGPRSMRPLVFGGLAILALILTVWLTMGGPEGEQGQAADAAPTGAPASASSPAPAAPPAGATTPGPPASATGTLPDAGREAGPGAQPARDRTPGEAAQPQPSRGSSPTAAGAVVTAEICRSLVTRPGAEGWSCTPAASPVAPGVLVFLTRVRSSMPTTVHHRWYRGDALRQQVGLRIQPNPQGYRTYSRLAVDPGTWRVEVRSATGTLLHEQRFDVR